MARFGQRAHRGGLVRRHAQPQPAPPQASTNHQEPPAEDAVYGPSLPNERTIHLVMDLALRIGEIQMSSGAGAADVTATILAITSAYGLPRCEVDVIFTSITVSCHRGTELAPITSGMVVRARGSDYTMLVSVENLVRQITTGKIRSGDATAALRRITDAPRPYPRWVTTAAYAGMAASIAILIGGNALVASIAAVITALVDRVGRYLNQHSLPVFFQQVIGGALATGITLAVVYSNAFSSGSIEPSLTIAAAITVLLSGLSVVSTVQDAVTGYYVTAAGRSLEIAMISAGLIAGVVLALNIAVRLGLPDTPIESLPPNPLRLPLQMFAGAAAAACFALASHAGPRVLVVSGIAGAVGALTYGAMNLSDFGTITSAGVAAAVIGFCGGILSRRLRLPPVVVAVSGLVPLLPGYSTYHALFQLAVLRSSSGLPSLMVAIGIALALGAGVVFGEYLAQPVRTGLGRLGRRVGGPRMAGPLRPARRRLD